MSPRVQRISDITDEFVLVEDRLVYVDAPLEGYVRSRRTNELFAFRAFSVVPDLIWHFVLLPVASSEASVESVFEAAKRSPPSSWISILDDRRGDTPRVDFARMVGGAHRLPPYV